VPALLAASLLWAFSFGLIKGELAGLSLAAVAAARLLVAAILFLPFAVRTRVTSRTRLEAAALGAVQFGLMYVLYVASFRWLAAWVVALLTVFTPLYVLVLARLPAGRARWRAAAAALLAVGGAVLVNARGGDGGAAWPGVLLLQASNLCFAAGQLRYGSLRRRSGVADAALLAWMYAGAAAAALLAYLGVDPLIQVAVFITVSGVAVLLTRPLTRRLNEQQKNFVGSDRVLEKRAIVLTEINPPLGAGMVRVDAEEWRATSEDGRIIAKDEIVEVLRIEGTRLVVRPSHTDALTEA